MKKSLLIVFFSLLFLFILQSAKAEVILKPKITYLMSLDEYKPISKDNIKSIKITRYTEAGTKEINVKDKAEINKIYDYLKSISLREETQYSCTDNTTVYSLKLKNRSKSNIEIECNWVVLKGKHYNFSIN